MMEWMLLPYKRYFDFSGRSCRKEYWMFMLLTVIVYFVLGAVILSGIPFPTVPNPEAMSAPVVQEGPGMGVYVGGGLLAAFVLGSFIPSLAAQVRRFHDQDKSGWMVLLGFVPYAGGIIVLVFMCLRGTNGPNRFGPDPLGGDVSEVFH